MEYSEKLERIKGLENTWDKAVNQTEIFYLIERHFNSPLPEGKTVKKAMVIGYDGTTAEMLDYLEDTEKSAIGYLLSNGGRGEFSFSGGRAYPEDIIQETSTAPGWCSMLTGLTAEDNGIDDNGFIKEVEPKSLFIKLAEDGKINESGFYVSWDGHFVDKDGATYLKEKAYIDEHGIKANFICADGDDGTIKNTLDDINGDVCSDFIFTILEYTDEYGHGYDYRPEVKEYLGAFHSAEKAGRGFIRAIESRKTYDAEDWLILITSDHGGYKCGHGGPTLQERITFIVSNKEL